MAGVCGARGGAARCAGLVGLLVALGCATGDLVSLNGEYRHRVHGYVLARPESIEPPWRQVSVRGSEIAYRRDGA